MYHAPQLPIDFTQTRTPEDATGWPLDLNQLLEDLFTPGTPPLLDLGQDIWAGLASIVVVWTGLRIAFGGANFNFWDIVTLVIGLSIPLGMLQFYDADVPGVGTTFPMLIPAGADQIAEVFQADFQAEINTALQEVSEGFRQNLEAARTQVAPGRNVLNIGGAIRAWFENAVTWINMFAFSWFFNLCFIFIFAVCTAQVLWAKLALAILVFLGPVLIPWMVWKPMSFLFWGWFRAMLTYSLYSIIAAAVLRVYAQLGATMINTMRDATLSGLDATGGPESGVFLLAIVPLFAAAFLAAIKVPELAGAIVGGPSGGGFIGAATTVATVGASRLVGARK